MKIVDKLERVRAFFCADGAYRPHLHDSLWSIGSATAFVDSGMYLLAWERADKPAFPHEAQVLKWSAILPETARRVPPTWPIDWTHWDFSWPQGPHVKIGGRCYQARYLTAARFVLGKQARYTVGKLEGYPVLVVRSPRGMAVMREVADAVASSVEAVW